MKNYTIFFLLSISTLLPAQTPAILWRFDTHDEAFGNAAMADLDADGKPEIAFSCYWGDSNLYVLNAEDGSLLWKKNLGGCNDAAPAIFDVDGDSQPEVILGSSCNPVLTCFNGSSGTITWQKVFGGTDSPPSVADLEGDGSAEILIGDFSGRLNCYAASTGQLKWQVDVEEDLAVSIQASPALVDVNGDQLPDIVVCTWAYAPNYDSSAVYAYDGLTHQLIWKNQVPADWMYHGAAVADVDEDGLPELALSSYDGHVYLLNAEDGSLGWQYATPGLAYISGPVTIGDLDGDGHLDLVYSNGWGQVDALDRFGQLKWSYFMALYESAFRGAALADLDGNETLDVIFASSKGKLYALDGGSGGLLWSIDLRADYGNPLFGLEHGPLIADFNNDDTLDIFVVGGHTDYPDIQNDFGRAYAIQAGVGNGPDWTMFQHDLARGNCVCPDSASSSVPPLDASVFSASAFPNPFSESVFFNVFLEKNMMLTAVVYDQQGNQVAQLTRGLASAGPHQFSWQGGALPDGVYYCRVVAGDRAVIKKLVLGK